MKHSYESVQQRANHLLKWFPTQDIYFGGFFLKDLIHYKYTQTTGNHISIQLTQGLSKYISLWNLNLSS